MIYVHVTWHKPAPSQPAREDFVAVSLRENALNNGVKQWGEIDVGLLYNEQEFSFINEGQMNNFVRDAMRHEYVVDVVIHRPRVS